MPAYYDVALPITTNGSTNTQSTGPHLTLRTGTNIDAEIRGVFVAARGTGTAGSGAIRVMTYATATSSSGTTVTPAKRNPNFAAATTSALSSQTGPGSTPTTRFQIGFSQTGGSNGWVPYEPDAALVLLAGGGANGNADVNSITTSASITCDLAVEFCEH